MFWVWLVVGTAYQVKMYDNHVDLFHTDTKTENLI